MTTAPTPPDFPGLSLEGQAGGFLLDEVLGVSPAVVYLTSAEPPYAVQYISPNAERFLGVSEDTLKAQKGWFQLVHPEDIPPIVETFEAWLHSDSTRDLPRHYRIRNRLGDYIWVEDTCRKVFKEGRIAHIAGAVLDVTEKIDSEERLRRIAQAVPGVIYQFERRPDGSTRMPYVSRKLWELYDIDPEIVRVEGEHVFDLVHSDDLEGLMASIDVSERDLTYWSEDWRILLRGATRWIHGQAIPHRTAEGGTLWHGLIMDITRQKDLERQLRTMSVTDPLTGLFNRRYLLEVSHQELGRFLRQGRPFCLVMIDLDHFKSVNDCFGHSTGDRVLTEFATLLRHRHRSSDVAARLGGEEFAVLLPETELCDALIVADAIREAVPGMALRDDQGQAFSITASLGVTQALPDDTTVDQLLERADRALYQAKRRGRNRVVSSAELDSAKDPSAH